MINKSKFFKVESPRSRSPVVSRLTSPSQRLSRQTILHQAKPAPVLLSNSPQTPQQVKVVYVQDTPTQQQRITVTYTEIPPVTPLRQTVPYPQPIIYNVQPHSQSFGQLSTTPVLKRYSQVVNPVASFPGVRLSSPARIVQQPAPQLILRAQSPTRSSSPSTIYKPISVQSKTSILNGFSGIVARKKKSNIFGQSTGNHILNIPIIRSTDVTSNNGFVQQPQVPEEESQYVEVVLYSDEYDPRPRHRNSDIVLLQ